MKTVTILIPTYNEEENIPLVYERVTNLFQNKVDKYDYRICFIDNCSIDKSQLVIEELIKKDKKVRAIFNAKNFGFTRSTFYGITQAKGDCVVLLFADMQDPPEVISEFIEKWEQGYKIVVGVKNSSNESKIMYFIRKCYYRLIKKITEIEHIEQFDGFGLYDKSFIEILRGLKDPLPYFRGIVSELGYQQAKCYYTQDIRKKGKTKFNFPRLYDLAMLGVTSYSKFLLRFASYIGAIVAFISFILAIVTFVRKVIYWDSFDVGTAAILIGVFFIGAVQLLFMGIMGEYIITINTRSMNRPLVIEEKRINFE